MLRHPLADDFDELLAIDPAWQPATAASIEATQFGRCFVEIIDWLQSATGPFLLWCHLGSLGATWDAPLRLRQSYCEPGDPPPPESPEVPDRVLPADHDPDELLGIVQSYAGQTSLLDACLDAFLGFLDGLPAAGETLLVLLSARGFPLGEHGRVGPCDAALFSELVHVPWMMRFPDGPGPRPAARRWSSRRTFGRPCWIGGAWGKKGRRKRGLAPFVRSTRRAVPAKGACPLPPVFSPTAASLLPLVRQGEKGDMAEKGTGTFCAQHPEGRSGKSGGKGDSLLMCAAPSGPFGQMGTVPFSPAIGSASSATGPSGRSAPPRGISAPVASRSSSPSPTTAGKSTTLSPAAPTSLTGSKPP